MVVLQQGTMAADGTQTRENAKNNQQTKQKFSKEAYLVARDITFAKALAGNDKKVRDRALKRLKRWLQHRPGLLPFTEQDFMRIWKGLFYCMWMSDKPLIQEECAENIAHLVHFEDLDTSLLFFKCGLKTLMLEWFGIDQLRFDKFLMFARRLFRQGIVILEKRSFKKECVVKFGDILTETVLNPQANTTCLSFVFHFIEIFMEELAKVSDGKIHPSLMTTFLIPFIKYLVVSDDNRQISHVIKFIFHHLLKQSDAAMEFEERFQAWKQMGFAGGKIDNIVQEKVTNVEEEMEGEDERSEGDNNVNSEKVLDPRAGRVDVVLPQLKFSSKEIVQALQDHKFYEGSNTKSKKAVGRLIYQFNEMAKGRYPLGTKQIDVPTNDKDDSMKLKKAVNRLVKFDKKIMASSKKPKQKKRKLNEEDCAKEGQIENGTTEAREEEVPRKKKKKHTEAIEEESTQDYFKRKLEEYFNNQDSNVVAPKKKKLKIKKNADSVTKRQNNFEYSFKRNSGTWFVYNENASDSSASTSFEEEKLDQLASPAKEGAITQVTSSPNGAKTIQKPKKKTKNLWDCPLEEGELEIFIPMRKKKSLDAVNKKFEKNVAKQSPFPKSTRAKKVKIDLKLNTSQEFHEHAAQIQSSPAIPFDANKKPSKPLLKSSSFASPVNPFPAGKSLTFEDDDE